MCTCPITIKKLLPTGQCFEHVVPCGNCEECRSSYQSQLACRVAQEASARGSLHFFTLTYNNAWLPVTRIEYVDSEKENLPIAFYRGSSCYDWQLADWTNNGCCLVQDDDFGMVCPSLRREDVKNWLKRYRSYCDRHHISKDFAFTLFGEYGERKSRPHYHALVVGLSDSQANILSNMWTFGFCQLKSIPRFNKDGSDAYVLTSVYVSKYIAKRDKLPEFVKLGYAEKPRGQSSVGFGMSGVDFSKLFPFLFCGGLQAPSAK